MSFLGGGSLARHAVLCCAVQCSAVQFCAVLYCAEIICSAVMKAGNNWASGYKTVTSVARVPSAAALPPCRQAQVGRHPGGPGAAPERHHGAGQGLPPASA